MKGYVHLTPRTVRPLCVTFTCAALTVELFRNIFAPSNSSGAWTVYTKILNKSRVFRTDLSKNYKLQYVRWGAFCKQVCKWLASTLFYRL